MVVLATVVMGLTGVAAAGDSEGTGPAYAGPASTVPTVTTVLEPESQVRSAALDLDQTAQPAEAASGVEGATLAFTGGDVLGLTGIALGAIVAGGFILTARRRSATA